jgi:hydrogenase 3 maturation protease
MHKLRDAPGDPEEDLRTRILQLIGTRRVYVLGLGNTDRADDGAGILVAETLKKRFPKFSFSEHDGIEGIALDISERNEAAAVVFVDAANIGEAPGTVKVIPAERIRETEITTHRVAVALMTALLEKSGNTALVVGIQPAAIEFRGNLSDEVRTSIRVLTGLLAQVMSVADT